MRSILIILSILSIALSGCELPAGSSADSFIPAPHPPKSSSLRETMHLTLTWPSIERVMTNDGVFFIQTDGLYKVDYSGKKSLFVSWAQVPTLGHMVSDLNLSELKIHRLSDDSLLLSTEGNFDYVTYTKGFYFQHISRNGQPLELIQTRLPIQTYTWKVESLDSSHALVYGTRGILDFKKKTYIPISQEDAYTESGLQIVGNHIITTDRGAWPDNASRAMILVYNVNGKLAGKRSLDEIAPVKGISRYSYARFASIVLPLSSSLAGVWIWREANHMDEHNDTGSSGYYFFAFDLDQFGSTQGLQLGYARDIPKLNFSTDHFDMTWLGGLHFVWPEQSKNTWRDAFQFTTLNNGTLVVNDLIFKDWQFADSGTSRTDDGSLSLLEYSASRNAARIQLINPDGAVRLSETLPFSKPRSMNTLAGHQIFGSHLMFEYDDQVIVYEIVNSLKQENSL